MDSSTVEIIVSVVAGLLGAGRRRGGVDTQIKCHLIAVEEALGLGFEHRQFIVGMCRADVFELFRSAVLRVHDLYRGGTGGGGDGPDVGAHKVQSYRRPRASPP